MANEVELIPYRTYATKQNMEKAIAKYPQITANHNLRYLVMTNAEGRFYPIFLGQEAVQAGVHHVPFCVAG